MAGASDFGPASGDEVLGRARQGRDDRFRWDTDTLLVDGTHTVTLVGKSYPVATATGVDGRPSVKVTRITRPP